jgi:hypothetical protein
MAKTPRHRERRSGTGRGEGRGISRLGTLCASISCAVIALGFTGSAGAPGAAVAATGPSPLGSSIAPKSAVTAPSPVVPFTSAAPDPALLTTPTGAPVSAADAGWIRVAHLDGPTDAAVSVNLDRRANVAALPFGAFTSYEAVEAGRHYLTVDFGELGRTRIGVQISPGSSLTVIPRRPGRVPVGVAVPDNPDAKSAAMAQVRVVHLGSPAGPVALVGLAGGAAQTPSLRSSRYRLVPPGSVELTAVAVESGAVVVPATAVTMTAGSSWSVLLAPDERNMTSAMFVEDAPAVLTGPAGWTRQFERSSDPRAAERPTAASTAPASSGVSTPSATVASTASAPAGQSATAPRRGRSASSRTTSPGVATRTASAIAPTGNDGFATGTDTTPTALAFRLPRSSRSDTTRGALMVVAFAGMALALRDRVLTTRR